MENRANILDGPPPAANTTDAVRAAVAAVPYWYHKIALPGGVVTPGWAPIDADAYKMPADLTGKRVLDVGAWDGYWSFEALRRGAAEVVAIDDFSDGCGDDRILQARKRLKWAPFDLCAELLGYRQNYTTGQEDDRLGTRLRRIEMNVQHLWDEDFRRQLNLGRFDVILCFGVLYHCRHPLLALDELARFSAPDGEILIESAILDDYSVYNGGLKHGYPGNQGVMEFYPEDQYGSNFGNWWVPTLACLAAMADAAGWPFVDAWKLEPEPADLAHCRGFVRASRVAFPGALVEGESDQVVRPASAPPAPGAPGATFTPIRPQLAMKVHGIMPVPRLAFSDNMICAQHAFSIMGRPLSITTGAFWHESLERATEMALEAGTEAVIAIDYDTLFTEADVRELARLLKEHPEADALAAVQMRRQTGTPLMTIKDDKGEFVREMHIGAFAPDLTRVWTAHFGFTILRAASLRKLPKPWFNGVPDGKGGWGDERTGPGGERIAGRIDPDIWFWLQMEKAGMSAYSANRVVVGHMELMVNWPDGRMRPLYQGLEKWRKGGKPAEVWK